MTPITPQEADEIKTGYVCAACWGHLVGYNKPEGYFLLCSDCREETPGFVSIRYVERRIRESKDQYLLAKDALREAIPWMFPHAGRTPEQILAALGY